MYLNIFISVFNQLDAQNLFHNKFISCLYMFRAHVIIIRRSKLLYTHVEAWNKLTVKQKFFASSWLNTEINITLIFTTWNTFRSCAMNVIAVRHCTRSRYNTCTCLRFHTYLTDGFPLPNVKVHRKLVQSVKCLKIIRKILARAPTQHWLS